jgi:hypothetical protein
MFAMLTNFDTDDKPHSQKSEIIGLLSCVQCVLVHSVKYLAHLCPFLVIAYQEARCKKGVVGEGSLSPHWVE